MQEELVKRKKEEKKEKGRRRHECEKCNPNGALEYGIGTAE